VVGFMHWLLSPGKDPVLAIELEAGWVTEPGWMFRRTDKSLATATNGRPDHPACSIFTVPTELARLLVITLAHQLDFIYCAII